MQTLEQIISTLRQQGPVAEKQFYAAEGAATPDQLMRAAFSHLSNEDGYSYYCEVLDRCGSHPEESISASKIVAYEQARQLLIQGPKSRTQMEILLKQAGL
tara:strand:- start:3710 stop:4012 length:303 start_codon:yes stop_codon:yes gene_type:complete